MSGTLDRELAYEILSVVEEITCGCVDQGRHGKLLRQGGTLFHHRRSGTAVVYRKV